MASKFQNRLVGTVILVAVGVIVLPGLLDGKKKHYKEEFAAIPLVPKPDDQQDTDMVPSVNQSLPAQPPEGAGEAVGGNSDRPAQPADQGSTMPQDNSQPTVVAPPQMQPSKPVEQPKPVEQAKPVEPPKPEAAPSGQAYVVQLGALKNAAKVNEIVAQLRLSGYRAYTVPSTPVQGQITRIYVGPDASKAKMQAAVGELKNISGLGGVVKPYSAR